MKNDTKRSSSSLEGTNILKQKIQLYFFPIEPIILGKLIFFTCD